MSDTHDTDTPNFPDDAVPADIPESVEPAVDADTESMPALEPDNSYSAGVRPAPVDDAPTAPPQHVNIHRAIIKIEEIDNISDLRAAMDSQLPLPAAHPKHVADYAVQHRGAIEQLKTYLSSQRDTRSMTDDDVRLGLTALASQAGLEMVIDDDHFQRQLESEDADWATSFKTDAGFLRPGRPTVNSGQGGVKLRGAAARSHMRAALGHAPSIHIPLYNSGFWIIISAPDRVELTELLQRIATERSILGAESAGGVFSNSSCYLRRHVMSMVASKISSHSVRSVEGGSILNTRDVVGMIQHTDWAAILTYMMWLKHHKGYTYLHTCSNLAKQCTHASHVTLNLSEMVITDFNRLTPEQRTHMLTARDAGTVTVDDVMRYRSQFAYNQKERLRLNDRVDVIFKSPTLQDTATEGDLWMSSIKHTVDSIVSSTDTPEAVDSVIAEFINSSTIRRYSQWIDRFEIFEVEQMLDDDTAVRISDRKPSIIDERQDVNDTLIDLVEDYALTERLMVGYLDFVGASAVTVAAYPQLACPKCGAYQDSVVEQDGRTTIKAAIPFEAEDHFFALL